MGDPRLEELRARRVEEGRPSMAGQRLAIPAWAVGILITLLSAGASAAVTYGVTVTRVSTVERDVTAVLARVDRVEAARGATERELAVLKTRLDAIAEATRETRDDVRAMRAAVETLARPRQR